MNKQEVTNMFCVDQLYHAHTILDLSSNHGLVDEVVVWSLLFMKEDPTLTVEDALTLGYNEWVK